MLSLAATCLLVSFSGSGNFCWWEGKAAPRPVLHEELALEITKRLDILHLGIPLCFYNSEFVSGSSVSQHRLLNHEWGIPSSIQNVVRSLFSWEWARLRCQLAYANSLRLPSYPRRIDVLKGRPLVFGVRLLTLLWTQPYELSYHQVRKMYCHL